MGKINLKEKSGVVDVNILALFTDTEVNNCLSTYHNTIFISAPLIYCGKQNSAYTLSVNIIFNHLKYNFKECLYTLFYSLGGTAGSFSTKICSSVTVTKREAILVLAAGASSAMISRAEQLY